MAIRPTPQSKARRGENGIHHELELRPEILKELKERNRSCNYSFYSRFEEIVTDRITFVDSAHYVVVLVLCELIFFAVFVISFLICQLLFLSAVMFFFQYQENFITLGFPLRAFFFFNLLSIPGLVLFTLPLNGSSCSLSASLFLLHPPLPARKN